MSGLKPVLYLTQGAKFPNNLWVKHGLVNGATGHVCNIIYKIGTKPPSLPLAIIVEMNEPYNSPQLPNLQRKALTIITLNFFSHLSYF